MKLALLALASGITAIVGCAEPRASAPHAMTNDPPPAASASATPQVAVTPVAAPATPMPSIMSVVGANSRDRSYTMADLEALDRQHSYLELVQHLGDIPPASRDAAWEALAVRSSIGLLDTTTKDRDPATAVMTADELTAQYPLLLASKPFTQKRAEVGIQGFTSCYEHSYSGASCTERFLRFVERDATNTELAMNAGRLVIRKQFPYVSVRFFNVAVAGKKHPKECADPELQRSLAAAEDALLKDDPILVTAKSIRAICK